MPKLKHKCKQCRATFTAWLSRKRVYCSYDCRDKSYTGKKIACNITLEERERRRQRMLGENNPMWVNGKSDKDRRNAEYKEWRIAVFQRDKFACQDCGYYNGCGEKRRDLHAHHLVKWVDSIELRYEIANGVTLCVPCHIKRHTNKH